jgi:hypothetical protein
MMNLNFFYIDIGIYGCALLFLAFTCMLLLNKLGCSLDTRDFTMLVMGTCYLAWAIVSEE